jgi:hypothetical protein
VISTAEQPQAPFFCHGAPCPCPCPCAAVPPGRCSAYSTQDIRVSSRTLLAASLPLCRCVSARGRLQGSPTALDTAHGSGSHVRQRQW